MATAPLPNDTARLLRLAGTASVATAVLLIAVKAVAWVLTDSVALLASLVDSMMDSAASMINLLAIRYACEQVSDPCPGCPRRRGATQTTALYYEV